jgi:hypothetical protein
VGGIRLGALSWSDLICLVKGLFEPDRRAGVSDSDFGPARVHALERMYSKAGMQMELAFPDCGLWQLCQ